MYSYISEEYSNSPENIFTYQEALYQASISPDDNDEIYPYYH